SVGAAPREPGRARRPDPGAGAGPARGGRGGVREPLRMAGGGAAVRFLPPSPLGADLPRRQRADAAVVAREPDQRTAAPAPGLAPAVAGADPASRPGSGRPPVLPGVPSARDRVAPVRRRLRADRGAVHGARSRRETGGPAAAGGGARAVDARRGGSARDPG